MNDKKGYELRSRMKCLLTPSPVELGVEEVKQQIDVDLGLAEHVHDGRALVLHLQQILKK